MMRQTLLLLLIVGFSSAGKWTKYLENLKSKKVDKAALVGFDGTTWETIGGFNPTKDEITNIATNGLKPGFVSFTLEGAKYEVAEQKENIIFATKTGAPAIGIAKLEKSAFIVVCREFDVVACGLLSKAIGEILKHEGA